MKGFNIAPQPGGSGTLPPVAEFIASLQQAHHEHQHHDIFGSTLSGIFGQGTTPKKHPHHTSTNSVPGLTSGPGTSGGTGESSMKKTWGTLIKATKVGRVSKLIGKFNEWLISFQDWNERPLSLTAIVQFPITIRYQTLISTDLFKFLLFFLNIVPRFKTWLWVAQYLCVNRVGRSRSEDSVYSPASEDGGSRSEGSSDSKSSLDMGITESLSHRHVQSHYHNQHVQSHQHNQHVHFHHHPQQEVHHTFAHGLGAGLAALNRKRKKFSASRASTPAMVSHTNRMDSVMHPIATALTSKITRTQLQRASSVPTRGPEIAIAPIASRRHDITQSQQPSLNAVEMTADNEVQGKTFQPVYIKLASFQTPNCTVRINHLLGHCK